jgi:hypothetical protein
MPRALAEGRTFENAAAAMLDVVGPASGAEIAALWVVRGPDSMRYVDSWCAGRPVEPAPKISPVSRIRGTPFLLVACCHPRR